MAIFYGPNNLIPAEGAGFAGVNVNNIRYPQPVADPRQFKPSSVTQTFSIHRFPAGFGGSYASDVENQRFAGSIDYSGSFRWRAPDGSASALSSTRYTLFEADIVENSNDATVYPYGGGFQYLYWTMNNHRRVYAQHWINRKVYITIDGVEFIWNLDDITSYYSTSSGFTGNIYYTQVIGWPFFQQYGTFRGANTGVIGDDGAMAWTTAAPPGSYGAEVPDINNTGGHQQGAFRARKNIALVDTPSHSWMTLGLPWLRWERNCKVEVEFSFSSGNTTNPFAQVGLQMYKFPTTGIPTDNNDNEDQRTVI